MLVMVVQAFHCVSSRKPAPMRRPAKLKAMIRVTATVIRDGKAREIPLAEWSPVTLSSLPRRHDPRRHPPPVL